MGELAGISNLIDGCYVTMVQSRLHERRKARVGRSIDGALQTELRSSGLGGDVRAGKRRCSSALYLRAAGTKQQREEKDDVRPPRASENREGGEETCRTGP